MNREERLAWAISKAWIDARWPPNPECADIAARVALENAVTNYSMQDSNGNPISVCQGGMQEILKLRGEVAILRKQPDPVVIRMFPKRYESDKIERLRSLYPGHTVEFVVKEDK